MVIACLFSSVILYKQRICSLLDNQIKNWSIIYVYSNSEDLFVFLVA